MGRCHEDSRLHRDRRFNRFNRVGSGGVDAARQVIVARRCSPAATLILASYRHIPSPQSSSASRFTAGAAGFLTLIQSGERPRRYIDPSRFDTMPSQPSLRRKSFPSSSSKSNAHASRNTIAPAASSLLMSWPVCGARWVKRLGSGRLA
jgi:hypothetical protein